MKLAIIAEDEVQDAIVEFLFPYGLDRSVVLFPTREETRTFCGIRMEVKNEQIRVLPDWFNVRYPILFPENIAFNKGNLLALTMYFNGLFQDAIQISKDIPIGDFIGFISENPGDLDWISKIENTFHRDLNLALALSYFGTNLHGSSTESIFESAVEQAPNAEMKALTSYHYAIFLQDKHQLEEATNTLDKGMYYGMEIAGEMAFELEESRCNIRLGKIDLEEHKGVLKEALNFYLASNATLLRAQVLTELSEIEGQTSRFTEAIGHLDEAIGIYTEEEQNELKAQSQIYKGGLLHTWAKNGRPQCYLEAIKAYQEALAIFRRDFAPHVFAEIHHQLAILYAEMPSEVKKKSIWAAVSATSFKEALNYFSKESYPLEYASICHNYGTALIFYPEAKTADNIENAIHHFREALEIRTKDFPRERASTLVNYLEACWAANNINETMEKARLSEMTSMSTELLELTEDSDMKNIAQIHLENIEKLQLQQSK